MNALVFLIEGFFYSWFHVKIFICDCSYDLEEVVGPCDNY